MKKTNEDLKEFLVPDNGKLIISEDGTMTSIIFDAELDHIHCTFNYDGCIQIDTENLTYVCLTIDNLQQMIKLIREAEKIYESAENK